MNLKKFIFFCIFVLLLLPLFSFNVFADITEHLFYDGNNAFVIEEMHLGKEINAVTSLTKDNQMFIAAVYLNNKLIDIKTATGIGDKSLSLYIPDDKNTTVKTCVWSGLNTMNPLRLSNTFKYESSDNLRSFVAAHIKANNSTAESITGDLNLVPSVTGYSIIWESSNPDIISNDGKVTRPEGNSDALVTLTATLISNETPLSEIKLNNEAEELVVLTYNIIVRAKGINDVTIKDFVDPYFEDGYPQAYMKDGKISFRFMVKEDVEVYGIVNKINGNWDSDIEAVLGGHTGTNGNIVEVNEWPYFNAIKGNLYDIDTDASLTFDGKPAKVSFVVQNFANSYISDNVTTIEFDAGSIQTLDKTSPSLYDIYINKNYSKLYLYFSKYLDSESIPSPSDFSLSEGAVITNVELENTEENSGTFRHGKTRVILDVTGIDANNVSNVKINYTKGGNPIQDKAIPANQANNFTGKTIKEAAIKINKVYISSDRKNMVINFEPGYNDILNELPAFEITVDNSKVEYKSSSRSYNTTFHTYTLSFENPLPQGQISVTANFTSPFYDWAMDEYSSCVFEGVVKEIDPPGTPSASFNKTTDELKITFADGYEFYNMRGPGCFIKLNIDGTIYKLRGYIISPRNNTNLLFINFYGKYEEYIRDLLYNAKSVKISMELGIHSNKSHVISDAAGSPLPEFHDIAIDIIQ